MRTRARDLAIGVCLLFTLLLPTARAADVTFALKADAAGWNSGQPGGPNPTMTVNPGDSVTVTIEFVDVTHNWALYPGGTLPNEVSLGSSRALTRAPEVSEGNPSSSVSFAAPDSGSYEYFCEYHPSSMHGKLVVTGNAAPQVVILAPTVGASWTGGTDHSVSFRVTDDEPASNLTVWLNFTSSAASGSIAVLAPPGPNPNVVLWRVPGVDATDVTINITALDGRGRFTYRSSTPFEIDSTRPVLVTRNPGPGATNVGINTDIVLGWSEPMNRTATGSPSAIGLLEVAANAWSTPAVAWSSDSRELALSPTIALKPTTTYRVFVNGTAKDDSDPGNAIAAPLSWDFTTGLSADVTAPTIASASATPASPTAGKPLNITAIITDPSGVASVRIHIRGPAPDENLTMSPLPGNLWYLNQTFSVEGTYTFTIWASDAAGNLASESGSFTLAPRQPPPPLSTAVLLWLIVPVGAVAVGIALLIRHRRRKAKKGE